MREPEDEIGRRIGALRFCRFAAIVAAHAGLSAVLPAAALLLVAPGVFAQSPTGRIAGVVYDGSRTRVADVVVTVTSDDTGLSRTAVTGDNGAYQVLDLPPGRYRVGAELDGFAPAVRDGVRLTMGAAATVDLTLSPARVSEHVVVETAAGVLDLHATAAGGVVTRHQIDELPLNGRSFLQLGALQPGVIVSRGTGREFSSGFGQTQLSLGGGRPEQTGFLLDGTNIADISDKAPSSLAGLLLGVDAIREFSVQTHGYSAEFGRAAGGIVSAVTRSGTNRFHGSLFEFHRNSALDARGFFDPEDAPALQRNQFGGSMGGPIRRDTLFFFGAYEGLRDREVVTRTARLPDSLAHQGLLPDGAGGIRHVSVHPSVRPYLDRLFPIPDGASFGDGTAELRHTHQDPTDEDFLLLRGDWNVAAGGTVMARFSGDRSRARATQDHPLFVGHTGTRQRYLTAQYQRPLGSTAANSLRAAVNHTGRDDDELPTIEIPGALLFTEDPHWGAIVIAGLTPIGSSRTIPAEYRQDVYQVADTFTWQRGAHVLKAGFDWQHYRFEGSSYSRYGGEFRFRNLEEFLTLRRSASAQADRFTGNLPGTDTYRRMRQHYAAFFVQDEWRARDDVTIDAGLRYELATTPTEAAGLVAGLLRFEDLESGPRGVTPGAPLFDNPSKRSFAPRLGVSWRPGGSGRTIVRGGYGLFHQPLTVSYYRGTIFRIYPYFAGVDLRQPAVFGPGIRDVLAGGADAQRRSEFIHFDAKQPFVQQWHVRVERDLGAGLIGEVGYLGSRGHNLPLYGDPNSVPAEYTPDGRKRVVPGASIRYPSWGRIRTRINAARSRAHALTAGVRRIVADRLVLQGAYTLSDSNDTWSGQQGSSDFINGAGSVTDWWDPEAEYGPSNFDVRHTLVVNATWPLPFGREGSGVIPALVRGWSVSGILQLASGLPFTPFIGFDRAGDQQSDADAIQKPDQVGPVRYPRTPEAWFDAAAFALPPAGYYGTAPRNGLRGPGLKLLDVAALRNVPLGRATLQLRLEAFNVLNWVNLGLPDASVLFNTDGTHRPGAARITTTATPGREVQLGVKLLF